jgi:hypothetical protein
MSLPRKKDTKKAVKKNSLKKSNTQSLSSFSNPSSEQNSSEDLPLSAPEQLNVNKLLSQALTRYKNDSLIQDKQDKLQELEHLGKIVEEYLSCFTLIGFTMQGEKVCLFNASTSKDEGALVDLLRSTFLEIVNNRP